MGRVATLVKTDNPGDRVYGVAYEIDREGMVRTFEHLNFREKCGYGLHEIEFKPLDESVLLNNGSEQSLTCVCYFANEENAYYSPQLDLILVSYQIYKTRGPSGENREYLYMLCKTLRDLATEHFKSDTKSIRELLKFDDHLFELERLVVGLESKEKNSMVA
jgi:cation transport regulator ChaC